MDDLAHETKPKWVLWSTRESLEGNIPSITAIIETLLAVPVYWFIAVKFETYLPLLLSALVAPLVLLRSDESTALGARWFTRWALATRRDLDRQHSAWPKVNFVVPVGLIVSTVFTYVIATRFLFLAGPSSSVIFAIGLGWASLALTVAVCVAGRQIASGEAALSATAVLAIALMITGSTSLILAGLTAEIVFGFSFGVFSGIMASGLALAGTAAIIVPLVFGFLLAIGAATSGIAIRISPATGRSATSAVVLFGSIILAFFINPVFSGFGLGVLFASLVVRVAATMRHPILGLRNLPQNFRRLALCTSPLQEPELVPGVLPGRTGFTLSDSLADLRNKTMFGDDFDYKVFTVLFYVPTIVIWFFPAWVYRITLKATAWFWWPLIYLGSPSDLPAHPEEVRRKTLGSLWAKTSIVLALGSIAAFLFVNLIWSGAALSGNPLLTILGYGFLIDWSAVLPWQFLSLALAVLSILVVYLVDDATGQYRTATSVEDKQLLNSSKAKIRGIGYLTRLRLFLFVFFVLCVAGQAVLYLNGTRCWFDLPANAKNWAIWLYGGRVSFGNCSQI